MTYDQLTERERYTISRLCIDGCGVADTARILGRHRSTVYRELQRNKTTIGNRTTYCPSLAHSVGTSGVGIIGRAGQDARSGGH